MIARIVTTLIGVVSIVYGVLAAVSPLPLGVPLVVLGTLMIAAANPAARPLIRRMRQKWRAFDKLVELVGERSSGKIHDVIEETDPELKSEQNDEGKDDLDCKGGRGAAGPSRNGAQSS